MMILKNIKKSFDRIILNDLNLTFEKGKIYVIKGISGSGKTTLLNIIAGLDKTYEGSYLYDGNEIKDLNKKEFKKFRNKIGYMAQKSLLISHLNILDNLLFIKNDKEKIIAYAKLFHIDHKLKQYPAELSGGERQRVALIRALVNGSEIFIADEPTSSLDLKNSQSFANELTKIKENRIIIIATHKNIYDLLADEIILIKDRKVKNTTFSKKKEEKCEMSVPEEKWNLKATNKYIHERQNKIKNIFKIFTLSLVATLLLITFSIKLNYRNEYVKKEGKIFPYHMLNIYASNYQEITKTLKYKTVIYENYRIEENGISAYSLFPKEDSNLIADNLIVEGNFPKLDNEILIDENFKNLYFQGEQIIGKSIIFKNESFTITGIVSVTEDNRDTYEYNCYYDLNQNPKIYIPYDKISKMNNEPVYSSEIMIKYTGDLSYLYKKDRTPEFNVSFSTNYNSFQTKLANATASVNATSDTLFIAFAALAIISIAFLWNQISLNLFYRRKEIGYLQIFNVSKARLYYLILMEYLGSIVKASILGFIWYIIFILIFNHYNNLNLALALWQIISIFIAIIIYTILLVIVPLKKYLKKDIITLIKE